MPAGLAYQGALSEGATKVAMRQDLTPEAATDIGELVELAATAINSCAPASVELVIDPHSEHFVVVVSGLGASTPGDPVHFDTCAAYAKRVATRLHSDPAAATIRFEVPRA